MIGKVVSVILVAVCVFFGLLFNIVLHEAGHYAVADYYGAEPKIVFNVTESGFGFALNGKPVAETVYSAKTNYSQDFWIALAGPAVNLALFLSVVVFLSFVRMKNITFKIMLQLFAAVSILAFFLNAMPASGTDGFMMLNLLKLH
ncbi:MAG: M50 family metallopeptidase [DPANN group archaeon]|nr:M50 family metallopeptidase [DPANN group archaeon]